MPWRIAKQGAKFCVVKISDGAVVACHDTEEKANAQRRALYASEDYGLQLAIQEFNLEFDKESDVNLPGGSHNLKNYWTHGPGAVKIRWGTDGSFDRCVRHLGKYVKNPQGLCAEYHKAATGEWPAEKGVESSMSDMVEAHGHHNQQDHNPHKGFHVPDADLEREVRERRSNYYDEDEIDENEVDRRSVESRSPGYTDDYDMGKYPNPPEDEMAARADLKYLRKKRDAGSELTVNEEKDLAELEKTYGVPKKKSGLLNALKDKFKSERSELGDLELMLFNDVDLTPAQMARYHELRQKQKEGKFHVDMTEFAKSDDDDTDGEARKEDHTTMYATGDGDEPWNGVLTVEGLESGDGRLFALGGLDWEKPPQPLMYQPANVGGHNGSIMVGNITKLTRHGSRIRGEGTVFGSALKSEHGENIRHMMETGGVSVDVDKVKDADVEMVYADSETGDGGNMFAKPETTIFHRGRIRGATLVAFPAFVEAKLAFTNQNLPASCDSETCGCETDDPLVASVHTITIPNLPKAEWFNEPTDVKMTGALTITDDGRVYGILAPGNTTHRSVKRRVPRGNVDYSRFHKAETIVEGGGRVVTGVITADCGHAPTENYGTLQRRREHYDNSCSVLANVRIGESKQGYVYAAGALNPGADPRQVAQALGCALSGDWQPHPDRPGVQEFIAAHLVTVPGFPMARTQASVTYQDGLITASTVPVEHVKIPTYVTGPTYDDTFNAIQMTKRLLVASVGLDPVTRKRKVMRELELM